LPFSAFKPVTVRGQTPSWTGSDLLEVGVDGERAARTKLWFELDDVTFY
jgi:hypothetical protein